MSWPARLDARTLLPPAGHAGVDQPGIAGPKVVGAEPQALGHARSEALDEHVRRVGEPAHHFDPFGDFRSTAIDRRPRPYTLPFTDSAEAPTARSARSTTVTSAPRSASTIAPKGAGPSPAISTTRIPASGPAITGSQLSAGREPPPEHRLHLLVVVRVLLSTPQVVARVIDLRDTGERVGAAVTRRWRKDVVPAEHHEVLAVARPTASDRPIRPMAPCTAPARLESHLALQRSRACARRTPRRP